MNILLFIKALYADGDTSITQSVRHSFLLPHRKSGLMSVYLNVSGSEFCSSIELIMKSGSYSDGMPFIFTFGLRGSDSSISKLPFPTRDLIALAVSKSPVVAIKSPLFNFLKPSTLGS